MSLYWFYGGDQDSAPYLIAITAAASPQEARQAFGEPPGATSVHELTSPAVLARCGGREGVFVLDVDTLPSAYDRFRRADGRMDYAAMEDAGFC